MKRYIQADTYETSDMDEESIFQVYVDYPGKPVYTLATYRQLDKLEDHREIHSFSKLKLTPIEEIDRWGVLND